MCSRMYVTYDNFDPNEVTFNLGNDRQGKPQVHMFYGTEAHVRDAGLVTPACVTNWPRVNGDGNFGTMWGPTDVSKAKFTLDLTDAPINGEPNENFKTFASILEAVDDKLLDFVQNNQLKILGRKNLSRDEVKMLQIRSVRPKYDKVSSMLTGHTVQLSTSKYAWDGMGGKYARAINVCDQTNAVIPNGVVSPGDVVAATMYPNLIYTGVGGDKFGIHYSFEDVQVVCQRARLQQKSEVSAFSALTYDFAMPYQHTEGQMDVSAQFSDPVAVG